MRVLAFDPGAERCGFACVSKEAKSKGLWEVGSGVFGIPRVRNDRKIPYQEYRLSLIDLWIQKTQDLLDGYHPDVVVNEIVPPVGTGTAAGGVQRTLATTAITVITVVARQNALAVEQVGDASIKKRIGGARKATKVGVRNGVYHFLPTTEKFKKEWVKMHDQSDAFACALTYLGCDIGRE